MRSRAPSWLVLVVLGVAGCGLGLAACGGEGSKAKRAPSSQGGGVPLPAGNGDPDDDDNDSGSGGAGSGGGSTAGSSGSGGGSPFEPTGASSKPVDTSGVTKFSTLLDPSLVLDTLSTADIASACQRYQSYLDDQIPQPEAERAFCFYNDAGDAKTVAECKGLVDDCRSTTTFSAGPCPLEGLSPDTDCTATLDDFEACASEIAAVGAAFVDYYDCSLLDSVSTPEAPQQLTATAAACGFLYATCPTLD